jgi:hypothetical protein
MKHIAPARLSAVLTVTPSITPPTESIDPELFDPMNNERAQEVLRSLQHLCASLPEVTEGDRFGSPAWSAGKKTFLTAHRSGGVAKIGVWVGGERQATAPLDERFTLPKFMGHNGWVLRNVEDFFDPDEVRELVLTSYRHFALKRMLKQLDAEDGE